jgi:hypothetical protein
MPPPSVSIAPGHERRHEQRMAKVAEAFKYRQEHPDATLAEIGEHVARAFGVERCSSRTIADYFWDPQGVRARERKERYRGTCERCGRALHGGAGRGRGPARCADCGRVRTHSAETVCEALRRWERCYGFIPTSTDLNRTEAGRRGPEAIGRYEEIGLSASTVRRYFASFADAITTAFGPDARPGHRTRR